jgi:acetyl esterase/lipase
MKKLIFLFGIPFFMGLNAFSQPVIKTIKVWPDSVPGSIADAGYLEQTIVENGKIVSYSQVTNPTLMVYLPLAGKGNGTAVIICPGGGYERLAFDHEGYQIAEWYSKLGVTAIILKYRLPSDKIMKDKTIGPLQDAQEAIRIVRRHAAEWKIDPHKVGIMGFSAGGHLAATASTHFNDVVYALSDTISARPDFSVLIYPVISMDPYISHMGSRQNLLGDKPNIQLVNKFSNETQVTKETPQAFIVHASDDGAVPVKNSLRYYETLNRNGIPVEMHLYQTGGHGFGLGRTTNSESTWPDALKKWMKGNKLL